MKIFSPILIAAAFGASAGNLENNRWEVSYGDNTCYARSMLPITQAIENTQISVVVALTRPESNVSIRGEQVRGRIIQIQIVEGDSAVKPQELFIGTGALRFQATSQTESESGWLYFLLGEEADAVWAATLNNQDMVIDAGDLGRFSFSLTGTDIAEAMVSACSKVSR
ncbi:hypothetical protein [Ferrimonas balearica]|uniref:hypothetical protein n=1 Tax=Ferrimonas balearica TaxID=44012 RepID=UPI0011D0E7E6|nr:hypothetical protein [Ferrimonas balearica]